MTVKRRHKIFRSWSLEDRYLARCVCGWSKRHRRSCVVSLAAAAHRTAAGLNPKVSAS